MTTAAPSRTHDLPVAWDGDPVRWRRWVAVSGISHEPVEEAACRSCGLIDARLFAHGTVGDESGRQLLAQRCAGCRHDVVTDLASGEVWDLDEDDYDDGGSHIEGVLF